MTSKEAISNLNHLYGVVDVAYQKSLDIAIKALEEQPTAEWKDRQFVSCGKILRWRANVIEQNCSNCNRYCIKWAETMQLEYCPHCGAKMTGETFIQDLLGDNYEK